MNIKNAEPTNEDEIVLESITQAIDMPRDAILHAYHLGCKDTREKLQECMFYTTYPSLQAKGKNIGGCAVLLCLVTCKRQQGDYCKQKAESLQEMAQD